MAEPTQAASPLLEASATSLDELFSRDPETLTGKDLDTIIVELRRQRAAFAKAEEEGAKLPKGKRTAKGKEELTLEDLGLA